MQSRPIPRPWGALTLCLVLLVGSTLVFAADKQSAGEETRLGFSQARLGRIDARMQDALADGSMVGAQALIARHGEVVYRQSWGKADREADLPMREDAIFRIYSMSKPITSVALLMLYEEGHFLLSDPVARYLPEFAQLEVLDNSGGAVSTRAPKRAATIRDLLRHTAGFTYGLFGDTAVDRAYREARLFEQADLADFTKTLSEIPLQYDPGERWHYSVSVDIQGRLIEVLSGQRFGEFLAQRIFEPLGMRDTSFRIPENKRERLAQLYSPLNTTLGWDQPWQFSAEQRLEVADPAFSRSYFEESLFESGGAGLLSTTDDYLRFAQMLANDGILDGVRLLAPGTVDLLRRDHLQNMDRSNLWRMDGFGLGVGVVENTAEVSGELGADGSYGWGGAAGTNCWIDPENGIVGLFMVQSVPHQTTLSGRFRVLTYQALID